MGLREGVFRRGYGVRGGDYGARVLLWPGREIFLKSFLEIVFGVENILERFRVFFIAGKFFEIKLL